MCEIITIKHDVSGEIKDIQEVENNVMTNQKVISLEKKFETAVLVFLCLVTLTLPRKHSVKRL